MATNTILTPAQITKESMVVLHNQLGFIKGVSRDYDAQFAQTGAKVGESINVRLPNQFAVQQGPAIVPQGTTEASVALTLNRQWVVPMTFSSKELTLSIDMFRERYIVPAISKLASQIDYDCYKAVITGSFADGVACSGAGPANFTIGTPGTTPGTGGGSAVGLLQYNSPAVYLNAGRILDINGYPEEGRTLCIDPAANAASVAGLAGLYNPQQVISEQYRKGRMVDGLGFFVTKDTSVYALTAGTQLNTTAATMQATWTTGANLSWTVDSSDNGKTLKAGSTFTVADCYHVNPENQQSTGVLAQWVVTSDVDLTTGTVSVPVSPTPIVAGSGVVNGNCSVAPTTGKAITMTSGTAGAASPMNLAFHKSACVLGTADLELPPDVQAHRENMDGISMRFLRQYNAMSDFTVYRIDVLGGFSVLRQNGLVRVAG